MSFAEGQRIAGRFELRRRLGAGGLAEVWAAHDTVTGAEVALKALHEHLLFDQGLVERFKRELSVTRGLDHPGIVRVYDLYQDQGRPFFAMELLEGETVAERLRRGPVPVPEAKRVAVEVCRALACAHRAGVVHRDLKPQNIFLTDPAAPGGPSTVKLLDFGLARAAGLARLSAQSTVMGTPGYVAPELLAGESADGRSDLYALGATLFEMLAGRRAYPYADPYEVQRKQQAPAPSLREAGVQVGGADDALVRRALDPDPERRFTDAVQMEWALRGRSDPAPTLVPQAMTAGKFDLVVHRNRDREWQDERADFASLVQALGGYGPEEDRTFARLARALGNAAVRQPPSVKRWLSRLQYWAQAPLVSGCSLETARRLATFCQERRIAASVQPSRPAKLSTRIKAGMLATLSLAAAAIVQFSLSVSSGSKPLLLILTGLGPVLIIGNVIYAAGGKSPFSALPEGDPAVRRLLEGIRRRGTRLLDQVTAAPQAAQMLADDLVGAAHELVAEAERLGERAALLQDPLTPLPGQAAPLAGAPLENAPQADRDRLVSQLLEMAAALDEAIAATSIAAKGDEVGPALARVREETSFARSALPEVLAIARGDAAGEIALRAGVDQQAPPDALPAVPPATAPIAVRASDRGRQQ